MDGLRITERGAENYMSNIFCDTYSEWVLLIHIAKNANKIGERTNTITLTDCKSKLVDIVVEDKCGWDWLYSKEAYDSLRQEKGLRWFYIWDVFPPKYIGPNAVSLRLNYSPEYVIESKGLDSYHVTDIHEALFSDNKSSAQKFLLTSLLRRREEKDFDEFIAYDIPMLSTTLPDGINSSNLAVCLESINLQLTDLRKSFPNYTIEDEELRVLYYRHKGS